MAVINLDDEDFQKRSFPEDEKYENGSYFCRCVFCNNIFVGYKRRVCCKLCEIVKEDK